MILLHQIPAFVTEYSINWQRNEAGFHAFVHFKLPSGARECRLGRGMTDKLAFFDALEKAAIDLDTAEKAAGIQP